MSDPFPESLIPRILFEDQHLIVLDKPAGLLSQGEHTGAPNLVDWLRGHFGRHYVGLIHRLDRNTSGIMVVAKRTKSANRLTDSLQAGKIDRTYLGLLMGTLQGETQWRHRLLKDPDKNEVRIVPASNPKGQEAVMTARPIRALALQGEPVTLAEFRLETGRSHQIRAQCAAEGHPLVGDSKYARGPSRIVFPRPALHSYRLSLPHPMSEDLLRLEAPLARDIQELLNAGAPSG